MATAAEQSPAASGAGTGGEQQGRIDLGAMSVQQLASTQRQLQQDVQGLSEHHGVLVAAREKFEGSQKAVADGAGAEAGHEVLVPLTSSLYVPGTLTNPDKVLVELGTGYFIEKSAEEAGAFLGRKVAMIRGQLTQLTAVIQRKQQMLDQVTSVLRTKVMEQERDEKAA